MNAFAALADPTRLRIFELIAQGEKSVGEIVTQFAVTAPAISQHLKVLKEARLVRVRTQAQKRIYAVDDEGLQELEQWVQQQRAHWNRQLNALEEYLDTTYPQQEE